MIIHSQFTQVTCESYFHVKRTVSVISSDPTCKCGDVGFTTLRFKAFSDQIIRYLSLKFGKLIHFNCGFSSIKNDWRNFTT